MENFDLAAWRELAHADGAEALKALSEPQFKLICDELYRAGVPATANLTRDTVLHLIWAAAEEYCPTGEWANNSLHSAVACAALLKLAQQAFDYDEEEEKAKAIDAYAAKLGLQ